MKSTDLPSNFSNDEMHLHAKNCAVTKDLLYNPLPSNRSLCHTLKGLPK